MKIVTFEVAKAIKEAGYSQGFSNYLYDEDGALASRYDYEQWNIDTSAKIDVPTYLDVWLWLWREKNIRFDIEDLWDEKLSYPERGCASNTNQFGGICTPEVSDPEEAIVAAIDYLVANNLIK